MKRMAMLAGILVAGVAMAAELNSQSASGGYQSAQRAETDRRAELVSAILAKWNNHIQEVYQASPDQWASQMAPLFERATLEALLLARNARHFDQMNNALLGIDQVAAISSGVSLNGQLLEPPSLLGDPDRDVVYVPVTPCRILDTRIAGGAIAANTVRSFDVTAVSNYSSQGGDASNCNGVGAAGSFAAAVINFTVVTPSTAGYITAFPYLGTQPLAATVNYLAGDIRGNTVPVKLDQGASADELSVYTLAQTHLVGDIVGYFTEPEATAVECVEKLSSSVTIAAGSFGTQSTPSCDAGYTITGGGCSMSNFDGRVVTTRTIVSGSSQTHFCAFRNEGGLSVDGLAYARCCRVPGR